MILFDIAKCGPAAGRASRSMAKAVWISPAVATLQLLRVLSEGVRSSSAGKFSQSSRMRVRKYLTSLALWLLRIIGSAKQPPVDKGSIRSILVLRFGGIGDVTVATGLVRSLRQAYPSARITMATAPQYVAILSGNPDIDTVLVSDSIVPYRGVFQFLRAVRQLRRWSRPSIDVAIFAHNFFYMMLLARFVRARYKVGFDTNERGFDFALTHSVPIYGRGHPREFGHEQRHINEYFHDLLRAFCGQPLPASAPRIELLDDEAAAAAASLHRRGLRRRRLILAPGGSDALKIWPIDRFAALAARAIGEYDLSVVVVGGPEEAKFASRFRGLGSQVWFAAGELSLRQSIATIGQALLVVGSDTGMLHVAAALGVSTIAIFGPTPSKVYGYSGQNHLILRQDLPCVPCKETKCRLLEPNSTSVVPPCLDAISTEMVWGQIAKMVRDAP